MHPFQLESGLKKLDREIESLRAAVADKINPTKLVETRLETRMRRPVLERVQVSLRLTNYYLYVYLYVYINYLYAQHDQRSHLPI